MVKRISRNVLKMNRKDRLRFRRQKFIMFSCSLIGIIIIFSLLIYSLHLRKQLKDINYAINYHFTRDSIRDERLVKIDDYELLFSDDETAIVEARGLSYHKPRVSTVVQKTLKRNSNGNCK